MSKHFSNSKATFKSRLWTVATRQKVGAVALTLLTGLHAPVVQAGMDAYIGEMMLFAGNFCPKGTAWANGQLMSVAQNQTLFTILGTTYGGDGITTFALPNMSGRAPIGAGQGAGLSNISLGQIGGSETVTILQSQMPAHTHAVVASTSPATHATPSVGRVLAQTQNAGGYVDTSAGNLTPLALNTASIAGGGQPLSKRDPYLGMMWCITTQGIYPSRP